MTASSTKDVFWPDFLFRFAATSLTCMIPVNLTAKQNPAARPSGNR